MIDVAIQMLYGDRAKYLLLISGIAFSTILIAQGLAMFFGITSFSYATMDNVRAQIWVVDPKVQQVMDNQPLKDTDVYRVRSVPGVAWAAPLYSGQTQARVVGSGESKTVTLIGIDADTLYGVPQTVISGSIAELKRSRTVAIDQDMSERLATHPSRPLKPGDSFEMNDRTAEVVAVVKAKQGQAGAAYVFTTFDRAREYGFSQRRMTTHILAEPLPGLDAATVARQIATTTNLAAFTEEELKEASRKWMIYNTPIPFVVGLIVGIGFLVGVVIAGQTFYNFILDNTRHLGTLKAMGATNHRLITMTVFQAVTVGITGYGIGGGMLAFFFNLLPTDKVPLRLEWQVAVIVFLAIQIIISIASGLAIRKLLRIEPAIVFRS
jgi:putative ABC transport system permease protein